MGETDRWSPKGTLTSALIVAFVLALTLSLQFFLGTPKGLKLVPSGIALFALILINSLLIAIFLLLIGRILVKLWINRRKGLPGSRFSVKLVSSVLLATTVPALFLFFVSAGFLSKSVEIWFNERREAALKAILDVAQEFTDLLTQRSWLLSRSVEKDMRKEKLLPLKPGKDAYWKTKWILQKNAKLFGAKIVEVYYRDGRLYASNLKERRNLHREIGIKKSVQNAFAEGQPHGFYHKRYFCYLYPVKDAGAVIFSAQKLSKKVASAIQGTIRTYHEFSSLRAIKESIKGTYIAALLMISALIIFSSSWYALQIAKSITAPIEALMNATREVAKGNLDVEIEARGRDELAMLIRNFNLMIRELALNRKRLEERNAFIETVVEHVATGVISIDRNGRISTMNSAARRILNVKENPVGKRYWEVFPRDRFEPLYRIIREIVSGKDTKPHKREMTINIDGEPKHLLVGASTLLDQRGNWTGLVIVLEDITELVKAQRAQAWEEVARRMAHEIKNPLTPISLAAQRLLRKLSRGAITQEDAQSLKKSAETIIKSVNSISSMVNEFYRFARLPETKLAPEDLRSIVEEVVELYSANRDVDFRLFFSDNLPQRTLLDREKMKSVFVNLIDNAIHAMDGKGTVSISAHYETSERKIVIKVTDTGCGIPDEYKDKLFLPYFSRRKGGTGLGLAIVDRIIADHNGYIRVQDNHPRGAVFIIEIPHREV